MLGDRDPAPGDVVDGLPLAPLLLEPEQFSDSIRTEVTRTCCVSALVSEPDVPATLVDALLRDRREAGAFAAGRTIPEISTR